MQCRLYCFFTHLHLYFRILSGRDSVAQNNHNGNLSPVVEEPALFSNEEITSDEINYLPEHQSPANAAEVRFAEDPMVDTPECDFSTEHAIENIMKGEDQINVNYHSTLDPQFTDQDSGIASK